MANIKNELNNIKSALYGKDVRGSIHDGIDAINKEVENTTGRQIDLENTFDQLVINAGNSNAEIVDARVKNNGTSYLKLGDRLNEVDSQLAHIENKVDGVISVKSFKCDNGHYVKGDGIQDDTTGIQNALDYASINNLKLEFGSGSYLVTNTLKINRGVSLKGINYNNNSCYIKYTGSGYLFDVSKEDGVIYKFNVDNLMFIGNKTNKCFKLTKGSEFTFTNIHVNDFDVAYKFCNTALVWFNKLSTGNINNCFVFEGDLENQTANSFIVFDSCNIWDTQNTIFKLLYGNLTRVYFKNSWVEKFKRFFEYNQTSDKSTGVRCFKVNNCSFSSKTTEYNSDFIYISLSSNNASNTFLDFEIKNSEIELTGSDYAISLFENGATNANNRLIENLTIDNCSFFGVKKGLINSDGSKNTVSFLNNVTCQEEFFNGKYLPLNNSNINTISLGKRYKNVALKVGSEVVPTSKSICRYYIVNGEVFCSMEFTIKDTPTQTGMYEIELPIPYNSSLGGYIGTGYALLAGVGYKNFTVVTNDSNKGYVKLINVNGTSNASTSNINFKANDTLNIEIKYNVIPANMLRF